MGILNILIINFKHVFIILWLRKITVMKFFLNRVAGCHLTKKRLHYSFFQMTFVKVFRSEIKYFSSFSSFTSALTQNSILKNLFKSHWKITAMGYFFSEIADFEVSEE